jgi:hypothetical protein
MLRKPFVLVFIRFGCWRGIMRNCYEKAAARPPYMLRKSFVLVFVRFRVRARHHEELL